MQTPPNLDNQQDWGGERYRPYPDEPQTTGDEDEQITLIGRPQEDPRAHPLLQAGFIASSSDNLFNPVSMGPSSHTYRLQNIPLNPITRPSAYIQPPDTFSRPLYHHRSHLSSYNNPSFVPPQPHALYTDDNTSSLPTNIPFNRLRPPPPLPQAPRPYIPVPVAYNYQPADDPYPTAYNQPFPNHITYQNQIPQTDNYIQHPLPLPPNLPAFSKTLPTVSHVPVLTLKHDFYAWDEGVSSLIRANGLIGHILDPLAPVDPNRPDLAPTPLPILPPTPSTADLAALNCWWDEDNIAQHILVSRLGGIPSGLIPSSKLLTRTAFSIYKLLVEYYGTCNFADCTELLNSLHNSTCTNGRVQEFVSKWRTGLSRHRRDLPGFAFPAVDFTHTAFVSLVAEFNALLDSGCTHHIIRDRGFFSNYTEKSISVGTANCGSLEALGTGDVKFRYPYGTRHIIFTLRGCLHAPSAPINLLSVGALVERGMFCLFSPGGITKIFFPKTHPTLPNFVFAAKVSNRLSFLRLDFVTPTASVSVTSTPMAFPASAQAAPVEPLVSVDYSFPRLKLDSMLWHRRFGHLGMEATRAALTKNYVTGVHLDGPFIRDHCIACIVGKSPQRSYSHNGHRASAIGELLHMDLCGPYPVQGPRGERYFYNILDDKSNFGFTFGLRLKSDAFSAYQTTEAFLERSNAIRVLSIRCGGELELTAGQMGEHLNSKGIVVQRTVPYAHEQNGKSERYIRTLEEGGQALLAGSGLPMSFWLDAVLTRQYLCNRLPTSTLPVDVTPFESITNGRKPNLSHLRVWGCDCYVAIPSEVRSKAGFKRFRAIFVGYEEHRVGWRVRDLKGKYSFSNDVIFNENLSGRLGIPRSPSFSFYSCYCSFSTSSGSSSYSHIRRSGF
jgi:hypothetical protein